MFSIPCFLAILSAASAPPSFTWMAKSSSASTRSMMATMERTMQVFLTVTQCHHPILSH